MAEDLAPQDNNPAGETEAPAEQQDQEQQAQSEQQEGDVSQSPDEQGAPEKYDLTVPEGFELNQDLMDKADPVFRDLGLNNDQANKLVALMPEFASQIAAQQQAALSAQVEQWAADAKADKDFGGANYDANLHLAKEAFSKFGSPELKDVMEQTGLGNHPEVLKAFAKMGKLISEDDLQGGQQPAPSVLYPNSPNLKP